MIDKNKTFICCITSKLRSLEFASIMNLLQREFGLIETILPNINWIAPVNYVSEMGPNLQTNIIILENTIGILGFAELKKYCMNIEIDTAISNSRVFNLNPGYISFDGMYLASHKSSPARGREYLSDNIWQEKQYNYNSNKFTDNNNTFSEFNDHNRLSFFNKLFAIENAKRCTKTFSYNYKREIVSAPNKLLKATAFSHLAFV